MKRKYIPKIRQIFFYGKKIHETTRKRRAHHTKVGNQLNRRLHRTRGQSVRPPLEAPPYDVPLKRAADERWEEGQPKKNEKKKKKIRLWPLKFFFWQQQQSKAIVHLRRFILHFLLLIHSFSNENFSGKKKSVHSLEMNEPNHFNFISISTAHGSTLNEFHSFHRQISLKFK